MGYELKLVIGEVYGSNDEFKRSNKWTIPEGGEEKPYREYFKDDNGDIVCTGNVETFVSIVATVDLCKPGADSHIVQLDWKNEDKTRFWYWYDGGEQIKEDCYGDRPKPLDIPTVLSALNMDCEGEYYRRFVWARDLLKTLSTNDGHNLKVFFYGH